MRRSRQDKVTFSDRLISVFASLFFSVPTSLFLSLKISQNLLALQLDFTVGGKGFLILVSVFSLLAFLFPKVIPNLLGWVWNIFMKH